MAVAKICFRKNIIMQYDTIKKMADEFVMAGYKVHIQTICNTPYLKWLEGLKVMEWSTILDVFVADITDEELEKIVCCTEKNSELESLENKVDIYVAEEMLYREPVNHSELITSCYLWNYETPVEKRCEIMAEHFGMEQEQVYYDYVSFQCVNRKVFEWSWDFDFFFESHVSDPEGINRIYSKPALEGMRAHSRAFLNTDTRLLSFGRIEIVGG